MYFADSQNLVDPLIDVPERRQSDSLGQLLVDAGQTGSRPVGTQPERDHPIHFPSASQREFQAP